MLAFCMRSKILFVCDDEIGCLDMAGNGSSDVGVFALVADRFAVNDDKDAREG